MSHDKKGEPTLAQAFLRRQLGWKPTLRPPLHRQVLMSLPKAIWWTRVSSIECVGPRSVLDAKGLVPFSSTIVEARARQHFHAEAEELASFDAEPAWVRMREEAKALLTQDAEGPFPGWCVDTYVEGQRAEFLFGRRFGAKFLRSFSAVLLTAHFGNWPCAVDAHGTLFLRCA